MRPTQPGRQFASPCALLRAQACSTASSRREHWAQQAIGWLTRVSLLVVLSASYPAGAEEPSSTTVPPTTATQPASAAQPAPATTPAPIPPSPNNDQLSDLDRRTRELRDQVFRSKARLSLLTETLLGSAQGGAKLVVVQKDQMGRLYQMVKVSYQLDGREVFVRSLEPGHPAEPKAQNVYDGNVRPGDHTLAVSVTYRGDGNKVFSYYEQYTFTAKAAHRFSVTDGQTTRLEVVCFEKGNPLLVRVEDRPAFDFRVESTKKAN